MDMRRLLPISISLAAVVAGVVGYLVASPAISLVGLVIGGISLGRLLK